jgi:urate oxidase
MAQEADGIRLDQRHGKARVRVGRVWRHAHDGSHHFVEWNVSISLLSHCLSSYRLDDNSDIVATDTIKNTVYVKAKECGDRLSVEEFAILIGKHFCSFYPQVFTAIVNIIEKPWERVSIDGKPHLHGFKLGSENHTTEARVEKSGALNLTSGIGGLALLKTTQVYKHLSVDICFFVRKVLNCQCYHCYILDNGELDVFHGLWTSVFQFFLVNKEAPVVFPYFVNH